MDRIVFMQSHNFEFLRLHNEALANLGGLAEAVMFVDPGSALTRLRSFAEELTKSIYKEERLPRMPQASFYELLKDSVFESCVNRSLTHQINFLRINGNSAAHGAEVDLRNAQMAMGTAHQLGLYLAVKYYEIKKADIQTFRDIKDTSAELKQLKKSVSEYRSALHTKAEEVDKLIEELDVSRAKEQEKLAAPTQEEQQQKQQQSQGVADSLQWNEAKTRALLVDAMLCQAGWDVKDSKQVGIEVEVDYQDTASGKGYVDYVLWSENGQPLAVVEAKRSSQTNLQAGREQARFYADSLEKMGFDRPVIFYTNGYETFIWDDGQYNTYRTIYGFYSKKSLEYLIYQRQYRQPELERFNPELSIADRPYQIEAIKTVANHFQMQRRKALVIQATGTGKTRVAIALSELLLRTGWGKRVLFLCDRRELRTQADDAFKEHLPSEPRCVIGETNAIDQSARIYLATYPGMMNRFTQLDVGFFDLIIADESHRSIYNKYRDLFDYFDSLQLGLTATPVKFASRHTFEMFDCESTDPTFDFGLDAAINNDPPYLCSPRVKDLTTDFLRDGIHYNDLSDEQKQKLEDDLGKEEAQNTTIKGKDIGRKIFSEDTDRIILENLMNKGIKDETSSLVGKTIIFAQRQEHAEHLEKLFCKLYPQYGTKVCKVIHNAVPKAESLIKDFKKPDSDFRIAISVDMMDTGIDVPELVNLVFARPVRSMVKFWQMIGRGTRLCENLFGPGKDKQEFQIFDHYGNFAYFEQEYVETEDHGSKSLLQTAFESRLELVESALKANQADAFDTAVALIRADINDLPDTSIPVKRELRTVHELQQTELLQEMDVSTLHVLATKIAPLMGSRVLKDKFAIQFDRLMANLQRCFIDKASCFDDNRDLLLADSQQRGAWGEAQLKRTLEMSGLIEDAHYETQSSFNDLEGKKKQTDYLIKLPDNKHIIIDSKVSLIDYDRSVSADTPEEQNLAMEDHVKSVKKHIDDLAKKDYTNLVGIRSPSFVLMFMPIEPAYIDALKSKKDLFSYGYSKGIVLVSHTTLIPILRTVANLWMMEKSNTEAREISEKAGDIYNQVCLVADRLKKLGGTLGTVSNHYNDTVKALVGNQGLHGKVERFNKLSSKVSKTMPDLEPSHIDFESERLALIAEPINENPMSADDKGDEVVTLEHQGDH